MATVIDTLVYQFGFKTDTRGLRHAESRVDRFSQRVNRAVAGVGRGFQVASTAALGIGAAAFVTGSKAERAFLKLQTQLGLTREDVEAVRPAIEQLSEETGRPLDELAEAYFSLRSAGLDAAAAQDTLRASAYAANAQLGATRDIAHIAGGAINAYGADAISGSRATDILIGTVKEGNLEARNLIRPFGQLLQVAPLLGVELESLGAIIAGATRNSVPANEVITQLRQVLFGLLRPTVVAKNKMEDLGISAEDLQRRVREDGLIATLQWLRREVGEDTETFTRLFESQEAVGLILDITGKNAEVYRSILSNLRSETGATDEAQRLWAETGLSEAEKGTASVKLALTSLYDNALVPLLRIFGQLPAPIQTVIAGMGVLSGASMLLGGPGVLGALRLILLPVIALFGLLSIKFVVIGALIAALVIGIKWLVENWDTAVAWLRDIWDRVSAWFGEQMERFGTLTREQWDRLTSWIGDRFDAVGTRLREIWDAFSGWFGDQIGATTLVEKWDRFTAWIGEQFDKLGTRMREAWDAFSGWFAARFLEIGPKIEDALMGAINWLTNDLPSLLSQGFTSFVDWIANDLGPMLGDAARTALEWILFQFEGLGDRLQQEFGDVPIIGGLLQIGTAAGGGLRSLAQNLPGFARGGVVPGARGQARAAIVHGGEMVLPADIADLLGGIVRGPPPPPAAAMEGPPTVNASITIGEIVVHAAPGQDPEAIGHSVAEKTTRRLSDEIESLARAFDSSVQA